MTVHKYLHFSWVAFLTRTCVRSVLQEPTQGQLASPHVTRYVQPERGMCTIDQLPICVLSCNYIALLLLCLL